MASEVKKLEAEIERLKAKLDKKPTVWESYGHTVVAAMVIMSIGAAMVVAWALIAHKVL